MSRPQILCVMRMPPDQDGHGGSQRAWHLLHALRQLGDVHFVLVFRSIDGDCVRTPLHHLESLTASVTRINIAEWNPTDGPKFGLIPSGLWDTFKVRSAEAPRFSPAQLDLIAEQIPVKKPDIIFAGRLCSAVIVQALLDRGLLSAPLKVVDFDDIMSKFARRRLQTSSTAMTRRRRVRTLIDSRLIASSETMIADSWHSVSVCTDEDAGDLVSGNSDRAVVKIPNVVLRERLSPRPADGRFRVLFAGNLGFAPNTEGLALFVRTAWPIVQEAVPEAELTVVGMNPDFPTVELTRRHGIPLHANVPSLQPFYEDCDVVIAPILFGSGTRMKILESMAYGRAVVSTVIGAEGMGLVDGEHLLLADNMTDFASALIRLARDGGALRQALVERAYEHQQRWYTPASIDRAVRKLVVDGEHRAKRIHDPARAG